MMKFAFPALTAALILCAASAHARAGTVTGTLSITIQKPLQIVFTPAAPTIPCTSAPGTVVSALSVTGGTGNPATFTASSGDTSDFAVSGANVIVGPNGVNPANCGSVPTVAITASQP
jgi:hypothetical protein